MKNIKEYFEDVETVTEYNGYFCSVSDAIVIVILGSICGLRNASQIHQWAMNDRVREILKYDFNISVQKSVDSKGNEIPAVQELVKELEINGCVVAAGCSFWGRFLPCGGQGHPAEPEYVEETCDKCH